MTAFPISKKTVGKPGVGSKNNLSTMGRSQMLTTGLGYGVLDIHFLLDRVQEEPVLNEFTDVAYLVTYFLLALFIVTPVKMFPHSEHKLYCRGLIL
jgi:hypothetical protein